MSVHTCLRLPMPPPTLVGIFFMVLRAKSPYANDSHHCRRRTSTGMTDAEHARMHANGDDATVKTIRHDVRFSCGCRARCVDKRM